MPGAFLIRRLPRAFNPPPLRADVMNALRKPTQEIWPGTPVIPEMGAGATDDIYTNAAGIPSYDVCGEVTDRDDDRSHGNDERVRVVRFMEQWISITAF